MEHDLLSLAEPSDRRTRQIVGLSRLKFNQPVSDHFGSSFVKIFPPCMTKRTLSSLAECFSADRRTGNHVGIRSPLIKSSWFVFAIALMPSINVPARITVSPGAGATAAGGRWGRIVDAPSAAMNSAIHYVRIQPPVFRPRLAFGAGLAHELRGGQ